MERLDLSIMSVRDLNQYLHQELPKNGVQQVEITNPNGLHSIAVGLTVPGSPSSWPSVRSAVGRDRGLQPICGISPFASRQNPKPAIASGATARCRWSWRTPIAFPPWFS